MLVARQAFGSGAAMGHNYEAQRRETFATFKGAKGLPEMSAVDFLFFVEELDADWAAFEKALRARGFATRRLGDRETVVATSAPIPVTPEAVWERERVATEIALAHDFYPDGWELADPAPPKRPVRGPKPAGAAPRPAPKPGPKPAPGPKRGAKPSP